MPLPTLECGGVWQMSLSSELGDFFLRGSLGMCEPQGVCVCVCVCKSLDNERVFSLFLGQACNVYQIL